MTNKLIDVHGYEDGMSPTGNPYNVPSSVANMLIAAGRASLSASTAVSGSPEDGFAGFAGWTAIPSMTTYNGKLVMRLQWTGGTGTAPTGIYVGPNELVAIAADAVDMLWRMYPDEDQTDDGGTATPVVGKSGWSPVPSIVADGARKVMRITWVGGTGTPPTAGYVSADGLVATAAEAADIKGDPGTGGASTLPAMTTAAAAATVVQKAAHRDALGLGPVAAMTLQEAQSAVSEGGLRSGNRLGALIKSLQDLAVMLAGDSTGDAPTEWMYQLGVLIAAAYPRYRVRHRLWNTTTLAYDAPVLISDPAQNPVLAWDDNFATAGSTTYGRKPDRSDGTASNSWSRDGTQADGDWTIAGGKLVRSSDLTTGSIIAGNGIQGDQKITLYGLNFSTVGDGVGTQIFIVYLHYIDGSNALMAQIRVSSAGVVTFYIFERLSGVNTQIVTAASPASIPGSTASITGDLVITKSGTTVSATFNGSALGTANLTAGAQTAIIGSTQFGLAGGNGNLIGMSIDRVTMETTPIAPTLDIYNGSAPGQTLAYQTTNQAAMLPIAFDAIFISHSHNYGLTTPAVFASTVRSYVAQLPAAQNYADIIIRSQNPETNPAIYPNQHHARLSRMPALARGEGWGYIPCYEAILATPGYISLINADGVHPSAAMSTIEANAAMAWVARKAT